MKTACNLYENFDFILTFVVEMTYINKQFMINIYAIKVDYPTRVVVSIFTLYYIMILTK
jgi:hypothetical protein